MKGTFKPGDKLTIEKVPLARIKKGDVMIFRRTREEKSDFIVHRVADIAANGLVTRGDNCQFSDDGCLAAEDIIGRVVQYERRGKVRRTRNGAPGNLQASVLHGRLHAVRSLKFFLRKPYAKLRESGVIARLWQPDIEAVHFETPDGPLVKYMHKGKTVAICWKRTNRWLAKRPYDFILQT
jgi:signal peptidase I